METLFVMRDQAATSRTAVCLLIFSEAIQYYLLPSEKKCPSGTDLMDTIIENVKHSTPIVLQIKT
jgi:hypothetical protein